MVSERQRIEASRTPAVDNSMPPPSYEQVNGVFASSAYDGVTDSISYFLGEVIVPAPPLHILLFIIW